MVPRCASRIAVTMAAALASEKLSDIATVCVCAIGHSRIVYRRTPTGHPS